MKYNIKAHPTKYNGVRFRSRLEARWAAFFDLIGWKWEYEPIDINGWTPDFRVTWPCSHSECSGSHSILVEVKPYYSIDDFEGHPCLGYPFGIGKDDEKIPADAAAAFGIDYTVTEWEMVHGVGGGIDTIETWVHADLEAMWKEAGNMVQWKPGKRKKWKR